MALSQWVSKKQRAIWTAGSLINTAVNRVRQEDAVSSRTG